MRAWLGATLRCQGRPERCAQLLRRVELTRPDVALVDIEMPPTHTDEGIARRRRSAARIHRSACSWHGGGALERRHLPGALPEPEDGRGDERQIFRKLDLRQSPDDHRRAFLRLTVEAGQLASARTASLHETMSMSMASDEPMPADPDEEAKAALERPHGEHCSLPLPEL